MKMIITLIKEKIVSKTENKLYETRRSFNLTPMARLSIDVTFKKVHVGARPERDMAVAFGGGWGQGFARRQL